MIKKIIIFIFLVLIITIIFIFTDVYFDGADNIPFFGFEPSNSLDEAYENFDQYLIFTLVLIGFFAIIQSIFKNKE